MGLFAGSYSHDVCGDRQVVRLTIKSPRLQVLYSALS